MAQVKKFNTGGSVQKMKYGNIIKNGTTYEMNEENMKRLEQYIAAASPDIQQSLANDWKLLMSGQDVVIDTMSNQRSTKPDNFSKGQLRRLGKDKSEEGRWHAINNTDIHKYNLATQYLGKFDLNEKIIAKPEEKIKWPTSDMVIKYDEDDKKVKSYNAVSLNDEKLYYESVQKYLKEKDNRSNYEEPKWTNKDSFLAWYDQPGSADLMDGIWPKIEKIQELSKEEQAVLKAIGLNYIWKENDTPSVENTPKDEAWKTFNEKGLWTDEDRDSDYIIYNPSSNTYSIKVPKIEDDSAGYHFNDDFIKTYYGYDHLLGKVFFNGQWYNEDDLYDVNSDLYKMLSHGSYDYINKNKRGDFDDANKVLKTNWSGTKYVPTSDTNLGPFYQSGNNYLYEDFNYLTKDTTYDGIDLDDKLNLFKYMDLDWGTDVLGNRGTMYVLTDAYGRYVDPNGNVVDSPYELDSRKLNNIFVKGTSKNDQRVNRYQRLSNDKTNPYYNRHADIPINISGETFAEGWLGLNENNETTNLYINPRYGGTEGKVFNNVPINVYRAIYNNDFWERYSKLTDQEKFSISNLFLKGANKISNDIWAKLNITDKEIIKNILDYFTNNRASESRPLLKNGGVVKYQNPSKTLGEEKITTSSPYESGELFNWSTFTPEDWLELSALALDLAGAVGSYVPGGGDLVNLGASTIGATTLGAISDSKRVKQGVLPKGTALKNALSNIGSDVISMVPIVGDSANLTKSLNRAKKWLVRTGQVFSYGAFFINSPHIWNSMQKMFNDENITIEDARNILSGVQTIAHAVKRGVTASKDASLASASSTPKKKKHSFTYTDSEGKTRTQELDENDIKALTNAKGEDSIKDAIKTIASKYNLSDSEKAKLIQNGPEKMGFEHEQYWLRKDKVKEPPTPKEDYLHYLVNAKDRSEALSSRTKEDFDRAVKAGASKNRVERHQEINKKNQTTSNKNGGVLKAFGGLKTPTYDYLQLNWNPKPVPRLGIDITGEPIKFDEKIDFQLSPWFTGTAPAKFDRENLDYGQQPSAIPELSWLPEGINQISSIGRLIHDYNTNEKVTDIKAKGIKDSAAAAYIPLQNNIPSRIQLTAGNASRSSANRIVQNLPPSNSDYLPYATMRQSSFDRHNAAIDQSNREYSEEQNIKLNNINDRAQMVTDKNAQIIAHNNQIEAQEIGALSELYGAKAAANRQSTANYMYEKQTEFDQARQKMHDLLMAENRLKWTDTAQKGLRDKLEKDPIIGSSYKQYLLGLKEGDAALPIDNWIVTKPEYRSIYSKYYNEMNRWLSDQELIASKSLIPYNWMYKTGGKMRSANDQIRINTSKANDQIRVNKHKIIDKNWESTNKSVQKAIGKMHDRVYNILMKILS